MPLRRRRSPRTASREAAAEPSGEAPSDDSDAEAESTTETYEFNGQIYDTYQDMVEAKRARNQERLRASGLLDSVRQWSASEKTALASQRGLKRKKKTAAAASATTPATRRKSNRLQGIASDGLYVEEERSGKFTVVGSHTRSSSTTSTLASAHLSTPSEPEFYRGRLNDGGDMTLAQAVTEHVADKWLSDDALDRAQALCSDLLELQPCATSPADGTIDSPPSKKQHSAPSSPSPRRARNSSPNSIMDPNVQVSPVEIVKKHPKDPVLQSLSVNHDSQVAKVVPDRIYSMAVHPSRQHLLVCAGDKQGHVGMWKASVDDPVDGQNDEDDDDTIVHLFKYHSGAAASLQWTSDGRALFSTSYDGTCRLLDVATQTVRSLFATYDDQDVSKKAQAGYGLDTGYHYYTQFGCLDHRQEDCFFVSTSVGAVYHVDSRIAGRHALTWQQELSERKINSVSLHPNGHSLITGGLDCQVYLWDVRSWSSQSGKKPKEIHAYHGRKSINSAFFSPSGGTVVATTMNNKLDVLHDFHLKRKGSNNLATVKPTHSIRHDNMTGRWLTTFQAVWHPQYEIFGVGSMSRPRVVEIFHEAERKCAVGGEALTAVASRLAFHPRTDRVILAGGNSSGRVTIVR